MRHAVPFLMLLAAAGPAVAQPQKDYSVEGIAKDTALTPVEDVNLKKRQIPVVLEIATEDPYTPDGTKNCRQLVNGLNELDAVLGPDYDAAALPERNKTGKMASGVAKSIVGAFIPFRGVIREVSGAAGAERRYLEAVEAGIARRGYLRGVAAAKRCKLPPTGQVASR